MTLADVRDRVEYIRSIADDEEVAHSSEDALHQAVLRTVADGHPDAPGLAREALRTLDIDFARWCTTHARAFDLETVPQQRCLDAPYPASEREPPANYKSDDAIARWREKDRQQWEEARIKTLSLSPLTGRIVCAATASFDDATGQPVRDHRTAPTEDGEAAVIAWLWHTLASAEVVVTFNGMGFDVPFLLLRSAVLGIAPPFSSKSLLRRYTFDPHYDVRMALTNWDSGRKGTLDDACAAFGLPGKSGSGADVWPLVQAGRWADLAAYAMDDAERTLTLYERLSRVVA